MKPSLFYSRTNTYFIRQQTTCLTIVGFRLIDTATTGWNNLPCLCGISNSSDDAGSVMNCPWWPKEGAVTLQRGGWIIHRSTCWHGGLRTTYKSHSCWFPPVWTTRPAVLQMLHTSVCERPAAFRDFSSSRLRLKRRETHKQGGCCYLAHRNKTQLLPLPLPVWGLMGKWVSEEFWLVCN